MNRVLSFLFAVVCAIFGVADVSAFCADAAAAAQAVKDSGMANATPGVDNAGVHTTPVVNKGLVTDVTRLASPDLIEDPVDREICKMFQTAFPIDQITRHLPQDEVKGMRYGFYSVDEKPIKDTVATAVTASTSGSASMKMNNIDMWCVSDTMVIPGVQGYKNGTNDRDTKSPLRLYVSAVNVGTSTLTVQTINEEKSTTKFNIPYIPANAIVYRLASAAAEGEVTTDVWSTIPEKEEMFMQIFKTQISESTIQKLSDKEADFTLTDQEELALRDLRKRIELAFIYGVKGYFKDAIKKKYVYTCAGAIQQILERGTVISYNSSSAPITTEKALITNIIKPIFDGNSGSASRYIFAGTDFVTMIATIEGLQKQMDATQVIRKFGIDWKTLQFMSWQLNLVQHPLLNEIGLSHSAIVLDLPYVRKKNFIRLSKDALMLKESGIFDGESIVWTEISSIALKYAKTHAFIYDSNEFAPAAPTGA